MARLTRFKLKDYTQHILHRGIHGFDIFPEDADYEYYLNRLSQTCELFNCQLHAYVLMPDHVHLLVTPRIENGVSKTMQSMARNYAYYFNRKYERSGTIWEGRYRSSLLDHREYLLTCYRYIELNPVRSGICTHPSEYIWSSYAANALGECVRHITAHRTYQKLGLNDEARLKSYRCLFRHRISMNILEEIRHATNHSWVLGDDRFKKKIEKLCDRHVSPKSRGGDRRSKNFLKSR